MSGNMLIPDVIRYVLGPPTADGANSDQNSSSTTKINASDKLLFIQV
jgi:hypothetical protein